MPKYQIRVKLVDQTFEINTDDYKDEVASDEVDVQDPDSIHDWIKGWLEDDPSAFNVEVEIDEVEVTKRK